MRKAVFAAVLSAAFANGASAQDGYRHTQDDAADASASASSGPVRMARFAFVFGGISWRPDESTEWSAATPNIPLRQGSEIWVNTGGRAEIQFDDGSRLHLGSQAIAFLDTLYSDSKGEFTEIRLNSGLATLSLTNRESVYQVDTPLLAAKAYGPAKMRIGIGNDVDVAVRRGEIRLDGSLGTDTLVAGQSVDAYGDDSSYDIRPVPPSDSWDRYTDKRDYRYDHPSKNIPSNIGVVCGDMDGYGTWRPDPNYGHVWYPSVRSAAWRPYHEGHWVWVEPFGWTWVSDESWGWAPYHYGTWIHSGHGWGWVPGPRHQYWAPAVVSFSVYNGAVAWAPLAPSEVAYPPVLSAGANLGFFGSGFSIGGACCYYPAGPSYVVSHPWRNTYANRAFGPFDSARVNSMYSGHTHLSGMRFIPMYGRSAFAITRTTAGGFLSRGQFQSGTSSDPVIFAHGHEMTIATGHAPVFSPDNIRPSVVSVTPTRSFGSGPASGALHRPVYRSMLPANVARANSLKGRAGGGAVPGASGYRRPSSSSSSRYRRSTGRSPLTIPLQHGNRRGQFGPGTGLGARPGFNSKYRRTGNQNRGGAERFHGSGANRPIGGRSMGARPKGGSLAGGNRRHSPSENRNHGGGHGNRG